MKLICGLGNPGREYERHRHNVGFRVVDLLLTRARATTGQTKFDAEVAQGSLGGERVLLLKPQTYMNLSGRSVAGAARFYKVAPADILVVHDELDMPFGRIQLKAGGGAGGHNGLRSILADLGEDTFARLRVGVGKPEGAQPKERVVGHVLGNFSSDEEQGLQALLTTCADAAEVWAREGMSAAMNRFNKRKGA
ncbi:MAG: aminoacyl-tRNA hydrolase [Myxococcaceae bacterium]|nr:aminoacyl-tRNA hydrolase [Myxococcaceae bacterium]MCI0671638.1 aminoacyl-tRNA hydrolase [Myxococcaceae bacterium]